MASEPEAPDVVGDEAPDGEPARKDPVASVAAQVRHLPTGDRAALRRLYLTRRHEADGIVIGLLHRAGVSAFDDDFPAWRLLAHVAALLAGTGGRQPHAPTARLGGSLHASGYSANRLMRLTAARGEPLHDQIRRAARMLAQKGEGPVNLWPLLHLAGRDAAAAEAARIRIVQDYYAAAARSGEGSSK